jgi:cytochrome c biogenesis protein CcdA
MEMPTFLKIASRKYLQKIHSPRGAFLVGILISLFLLPCTGGPYLTILSYLASESTTINLMGYAYLLIYNLVFITPFLIITAFVYFGTADIATLKEYRESYKQEIHLAVGILML